MVRLGLIFCCVGKDWPRQDSLDGEQFGRKHNEETRYWGLIAPRQYQGRREAARALGCSGGLAQNLSPAMVDSRGP